MLGRSEVVCDKNRAGGRPAVKLRPGGRLAGHKITARWPIGRPFDPTAIRPYGQHYGHIWPSMYKMAAILIRLGHTAYRGCIIVMWTSHKTNIFQFKSHLPAGVISIKLTFSYNTKNMESNEVDHTYFHEEDEGGSATSLDLTGLEEEDEGGSATSQLSGPSSFSSSSSCKYLITFVHVQDGHTANITATRSSGQYYGHTAIRPVAVGRLFLMRST